MRRPRLNCSGVLLGMRAEHFRQWLISATQDNTPDATNFQKVFTIMQASLRDDMLDKERT